MNISIENILLFLIVIFLFYHFVCSCGCVKTIEGSAVQCSPNYCVDVEALGLNSGNFKPTDTYNQLGISYGYNADKKKWGQTIVKNTYGIGMSGGKRTNTQDTNTSQTEALNALTALGIKSIIMSRDDDDSNKYTITIEVSKLGTYYFYDDNNSELDSLNVLKTSSSHSISFNDATLNIKYIKWSNKPSDAVKDYFNWL